MRVTAITTREQVAPEFHYAYDEITSTYNGRVVGPLRVLLYYPELARRVSNIGAFMRAGSPFPQARELAIIAAAREWDCLYEWMAHEGGARRVGVSEAAIDAVRNNKPVAGLPPEEALTIRFVRNLLRSHRVPAAVFNRTVETLGVRGTVELTATIGFYQIFACVMNAFEVPADNPINFPVHPRRGMIIPAARPYSDTKARVSLIASKEQVPQEYQPSFQAVMQAQQDTTVFQVLFHSPEVGQRTGLAGDYIAGQLSLPPDVRELVAVTTACVNQSPYLIQGHESLALQAGVAGDALAAAKSSGEMYGLPPAEAQVIGFTQRLLRTNRIPEAQYQAAFQRFGREGLVQLTALIGYYSMLACIANTFQSPPRPSPLPA